MDDGLCLHVNTSSPIHCHATTSNTWEPPVPHQSDPYRISLSLIVSPKKLCCQQYRMRWSIWMQHAGLHHPTSPKAPSILHRTEVSILLLHRSLTVESAKGENSVLTPCTPLPKDTNFLPKVSNYYGGTRVQILSMIRSCVVLQLLQLSTVLEEIHIQKKNKMK